MTPCWRRWVPCARPDTSLSPNDQDGPDGKADAGASAPAARLLAALLAAAERRRLTALVEAVQPPVTVLNVPDLKVGIVVLERGDVDAATLGKQLNHLVSVPSGAVLHLVLVGGGLADRPLLLEADRNARNPSRLGVWHLDDSGKLAHVVGRKLSLLPQAAKLFPTATPMTGDATAAAAERARIAQDETMAFATRLQGRRPLVTWILCGANILFFLLEMLWGRASSLLEAQWQMGANSRAAVVAGEVWRLLSHAFIHADGLHLAVNLIGLYSFGSFLERLLGWRRYLVLYTAAALGGGLASAFVGGAELSRGASGAIWGLMAAGFALVGPWQKLLPGLMSRQLRRQLLPLVVINIGISFHPLIDKFAHFGGGLVGFALVATGLLTRGLPAAQAHMAETPDPWPLRIAAGLALTLMVASVAAALITGKPWQPQGLFLADPG
jgi:rhomboid protease GluP